MENKTMKLCEACEGHGQVYVEVFCGYVTHDMAMDACDMRMEGMPMYGNEWIDCPECGGYGEIPAGQEQAWEAME